MEGVEEGVRSRDKTQESSSSESNEEWVADWLDELCPYYMLLGVSCDEFWHGDYTQFKYYIERHNLERQKKSEEMWLQGWYIYGAVGVAVGNILRKKGTQPHKYMEEPVRVTPLTEKEKQAKADKERQKTIDYFNRLAAKWKKKL